MLIEIEKPYQRTTQTTDTSPRPSPCRPCAPRGRYPWSFTASHSELKPLLKGSALPESVGPKLLARTYKCLRRASLRDGSRAGPDSGDHQGAGIPSRRRACFGADRRAGVQLSSLAHCPYAPPGRGDDRLPAGAARAARCLSCHGTICGPRRRPTHRNFSESLPIPGRGSSRHLIELTRLCILDERGHLGTSES